MPSERVKEWIRISQRGRTRGAYAYIDGMNLDDAILTMPSIVKAGIKDPKDFPKDYIKHLRIKRHTMSPGKIVLTLRMAEDIEEREK